MSHDKINFGIRAIFSLAEENPAAMHPILPSRMVDSVDSFPQPISFSQLTLATPSALQETVVNFLMEPRRLTRTRERLKGRNARSPFTLTLARCMRVSGECSKT